MAKRQYEQGLRESIGYATGAVVTSTSSVGNHTCSSSSRNNKSDTGGLTSNDSETFDKNADYTGCKTHHDNDGNGVASDYNDNNNDNCSKDAPTPAPKECRVPLDSFDDLVRMACAPHEHPRRLYTFELDGTRVAATAVNLANTLVILHAPLPASDTGAGYATYVADGGRETCGVSKTASNASRNAPLIHLKSNITDLEIACTKDEIPDVFMPVELCDLASLARLTYDPDFPDTPDLTLYAVPMPDSGSWALGYVLLYEMDQPSYAFYYFVCDSRPSTLFLRYRHDADTLAEFTDRMEHGYLYMPIIKIKEPHPIFGLGA